MLDLFPERGRGDGRAAAQLLSDAEHDYKAIRRQVLDEVRERSLGAIVDFLDSWRFCPVSQSSTPSRSCLEDAATQLRDAILATFDSNPPETQGGDASAPSARTGEADRTRVARRGAGESGSPPEISEQDDWRERYERACRRADHALDLFEHYRGVLDRIATEARVSDIHGEYEKREPLTAHECRALAAEALDAKHAPEPRYTLSELADLLTSDEVVDAMCAAADTWLSPEDARKILQAVRFRVASIGMSEEWVAEMERSRADQIQDKLDSLCSQLREEIQRLRREADNWRLDPAERNAVRVVCDRLSKLLPEESHDG